MAILSTVRQLAAASTLSCALAAALPAQAITYDVNVTIGAGGVTGTIETDGTLGVLVQANIVDWVLTLDDGIDTFVLLGDGQAGDNSDVLLQGPSLSATATGLFFDFDGAPTLLLMQAPIVGSGETFFCVHASFNCSGTDFTGFSVLGGPINSNKIFVAQSGLQPLDQAGGATVPLPAGLPLLLTGLAAFGVLSRTRG